MWNKVKELSEKKAKNKKIFAVVHGGNFKNLRKRSLEELMEIGFDGYCFGGWPIDKKGRLVEEILAYVAEIMPKDKPRYAMGVGKPADIAKCMEFGYNVFDCVLPTRNARHGLVYTPEGALRLQDRAYELDELPIQKDCGCDACRYYTRAYLHHLFKAKENTAKSLATIHNLHYYNDMMKNLQKHISI